jgi:hypothetical protein
VKAAELWRLDLERWERKALKNIRSTGHAWVKFTPDVLGADDAAAIVQELRLVQSQADARAVFAAARERLAVKAAQDTDIAADVWEQALAWAKAVSS